MPASGRGRSAVLVALAVAFACAVLLPGLGRYGLWEPWEVDRLEEAVEPATEPEGGPVIGRDGRSFRGPLPRWLAGAGSAAGAGEGAVRAPAACLAALGLVLGLALATALFGVRVGVYSTVILAGLPLYLVTGRLLVWSAAPVLATTLALGGAALAVFGRGRPVVDRALGLLALGAGLALGVSSAGPLVGFALPLAAAALGLVFARSWREGRFGGVLTGVLLAGAAAAAAWALWPLLDEAYRTSGEAGDPPTFERYLRQLLLGCFPWTGIIVAGLGTLMSPPAGEDEDRRRTGAATVLATGVAVALLGQTLWSRLAGEAPFVALWPLAVAGALLLERAELEPGARRVAAVVAGLFLALGLRDHALQPVVVLVPLADAEASLPEGFRAHGWFAALALGLGLPAVLALARGERPVTGAYRDWARRWLGWLLPRRRGGVRWIVPAIPALLLLNAVGVLLAGRVLGFVEVSCLERRIWLGAGLVLPLALAAALGARVLWDVSGRLGRRRVHLTVVAGALVALASAHAGMPALSRHLSSRGVVQAYERAALPGEPLLAYRASTRAAELLGATEIEEVATPRELVERLASPAKAWAVIRAEDLAKVDVEYRKATERHVPVADASSAKLLLLTSRLGEGARSLNPLERVVPAARPRPEHPVHANFDDRIELLGIDIEDRDGDDLVCPLESFTIRYYWHALRAIPGSYEIFVHVDGYGQRINGDHVPAEGLYPVREWQQGDFVVDEQRLKVPGHFRPGDYTIHVGFFQGSRRLPVRDGPATRDDRVRAGVLRVR